MLHKKRDWFHFCRGTSLFPVYEDLNSDFTHINDSHRGSVQNKSG